MLDSLAARLKYQYIKRDSDSNFSNNPLPNGGGNNPEYLLPYTSAFDMQSSTANVVKLNLDWNPLASVGVSFEGVWSNTDYDDVTFGRTSNDRQGYFLSGNWAANDKVSLNAFGSWEQVKYPSNHRYIGTVAGGPTPPAGFCTAANPNCYDPNAAPVANSSYNWNSGTKDQTWMIGVGGDWQAMDKMKLSTSYLYVSNEGEATFGVQNNLQLSTNPLNISNFDNSKQQFFNLKGNYAYSKNWSFTAGYSYMKYSHDDIATNGYTYALPYVSVASGAIVTTPASNASLSYGNGYDANTDGHSNIFYLYVTYKFDAPPLSVAQMKVAEAPPAPRAAPPAPAPAPAPAARARAAGAEDRARLEGAVRLRQGGPEARRQGGDRQPGHFQAVADDQAGSRAGHGLHRPSRHRGLQPEAVGASCGCGARLPGQQGRGQGEDRGAGLRREAAGRELRPEEHETVDRMPAAQSSRDGGGEGRGQEVRSLADFGFGAPLAGASFLRAERDGFPIVVRSGRVAFGATWVGEW